MCLSGFPDYCLRITTGNAENDHGTMDVIVAGALISSTGTFWSKGSVVLKKCYRDMPTLQVTNPSNDGWRGAIEFSVDGGSTWEAASCSDLYCDVDYGGDGNTTHIVVDGDFDGWKGTRCEGGAMCTINTCGCMLLSGMPGLCACMLVPFENWTVLRQQPNILP